MKFSIPSIVIVATAATAANALSTEAATLESRTFGYTFSPSNWYGTSASSKPWELNGGWGWYLGTGCSLPKWTARKLSLHFSSPSNYLKTDFSFNHLLNSRHLQAFFLQILLVSMAPFLSSPFRPKTTYHSRSSM